MKIRGAARFLQWGSSNLLVKLFVVYIMIAVVGFASSELPHRLGVASAAQPNRTLRIPHNRATPFSFELEDAEQLETFIERRTQHRTGPFQSEVTLVIEYPGGEAAPSRCYVCRNKSAPCSSPSEMMEKTCNAGNEACVKYGENTHMIVNAFGIPSRNISKEANCRTYTNKVPFLTAAVYSGTSFKGF
ncbi:hypothetical protein RvY_11865-3 [Ramazzottius varieornatus]|uniref:Uncharacterized protein n=1 Tax=Ramazzottius varieornatus TaxID=947166 RepID=A0A1D1VLU6_RAMVA|nr:hypothetical protein RvY_11865-3 [Ramazzottius varieornatus]